jgi:hypothetical protein
VYREAEGYTIVANIGDQPSDLAGGHSERTFLPPDPFYRIKRFLSHQAVERLSLREVRFRQPHRF